MKPVNFREFFKIVNFFYATIGIQPYEEFGVTKAKTMLAHSILFVGAFNLNFIMLAEILFVVKAFKNGNQFIEAVTTLSYIGFVMVGNIKLFSIWRKKAILTSFMNSLKALFPKDTKSQKQYDLKKYLRECKRVTIGFSLLYMTLIWTYNLSNIIKYIICKRLLGMADIQQELPYITYSPWDWHGHWSYYLLYFSHDLAGYTSAAGQMASDLLLIGCATKLIMHFDYVTSEITGFQCHGSDGAKAQQRDMKFLKSITHYHANLLQLSEQINEVFGVPLLLNFLSSSFVICFVGFQMTIGVSVEVMIKLFLFLVSSIAQVYLICHYGQQLIDASTQVAFAVYQQDWPLTDVRYQKMLILIAQRAQKPMQLKATSFVHVSRRTMSEIMQMSYKFFTLLRTMYAN